MTQTAPTVLKLPKVVPIFPLKGALLLPKGVLPLTIFEPRYLQMVRDAKTGNGYIAMVQPVNQADKHAVPPIYKTGCIGTICKHEETKDGRLLIALKGLCRFRIEDELDCTTPYRQVMTDYTDFIKDIGPSTPLTPDLKGLFDTTLKNYLRKLGLSLAKKGADNVQDDVLINSLAMTLPLQPAEKQAVLETKTLETRTRTLITLMDFAMREKEAGGITVPH